MKQIFIIAGPNGAGKTSFARQFLPAEASCPVFINADLIAAGLSPFQPERVAIEAGRLMVEQMRLYFQRGESFAVETTLASRSYARHIRQWRDGGYFVDLVFLKLDDVALAQRRVVLRVSQGGHAIDPQTIDRRFHAGLHNLEATYKGPIKGSLTVGRCTTIVTSLPSFWRKDLTHERFDELRQGCGSCGAALGRRACWCVGRLGARCKGSAAACHAKRPAARCTPASGRANASSLPPPKGLSRSARPAASRLGDNQSTRTPLFLF